MSDGRTFRRGQIHWIDSFPPLDGGRPKRRPVVLVIVPPGAGDSVTAVVAAATTTPSDAATDDHDKVPLPTAATHRNSTTGLMKPSWVLPRWLARIAVDRLGPSCGYVSGKTLDRIVIAVQARLAGRLKARPQSPS